MNPFTMEGLLFQHIPHLGEKGAEKTPQLGELLSGENGDGEYIGGTTSTTPNSNETLQRNRCSRNFWD